MAERAEELRRSLAGLRLERGDAPPPRRSRRRLIVAAVVLVVGILVALRFVTADAVEVEMAEVTKPVAEAGHPTAVPVLSGAGYVVSADRYISIGVRVAGRIDRYLAEEGDHVQAGDALVQLDAREYQAAVTRAEANLQQARATAVLKQKQLERMRALSGSGVVSREDQDVRAAEEATATAAVGQADAELAQARLALEYTTLHAPRRGVILAKLKEVGEIAVPGGFAGSGDLIRMANLDDLRAQVDVTESELPKVHVGQQANIVPDAYPDRHYRARVVKLYPQVDRQKGTLRVEARIEEPDDILWPDMSARITFFSPLSPSAGNVLVPRAAVRGAPDAPFAWTVADGHVRRSPLTLGKDFGDQVEVTAGLAAGAMVVVGEPPPLREGQAVKRTRT